MLSALQFLFFLQKGGSKFMRENTKSVIRKYNIKLTKSLGQNFLTDDNIIRRIADSAELSNRDFIIEIGPGIGSMTKELASRAGWVTAVEIDKHLIPALSEELKEFSNVTIINNDVMKVDFDEIFGSLKSNNKDFDSVKVVANLPYYITTPIIMRFLEENPGIDTLVFMVQKEVAERMAAKPGGKDYGALSVAVQYYSKPERVFDVPPHCFIPQPEVDSTVIRLKVLQEPEVNLINKDIFFKTVKAAFGQRRKTLLNALSNSQYFIETKEQIREMLNNLGIDENVRGESLTIMQFAQVANSFSIKNS
jgi:16S rRNA (adenine1518-N6/adenine1519-N6)-dimethyltransferase